MNTLINSFLLENEAYFEKNQMGNDMVMENNEKDKEYRFEDYHKTVLNLG